MELFREYALLIVVALPGAVIVLINLVLAASGERGTLLLPSLGNYPKVDLDIPEPLEAAVFAKVADPEPVAAREPLREAA